MKEWFKNLWFQSETTNCHKIKYDKNISQGDYVNQITKQENIKIENMIYEIRGKQVMLSSDVAHLYNVDTKV